MFLNSEIAGSRPPTSSQPRSAKRPASGNRKVAPSPVQTKGSKKSGKESSISSSRPGSSVCVERFSRDRDRDRDYVTLKKGFESKGVFKSS